MILSDKTIREAIKSGAIGVKNYTPDSIQPASLDIRLGNSFAVPKTNRYDIIAFNDNIEYKTITANEYILMPGEFVLGTTMETIELPSNVTAFVEGRSSIGRLGLFVQNAGWVDPGFKGEITLELFNAGNHNIKLLAGTRVAQLVFAQMDNDAENPYNGKYQGQTGATGSMIYKDFNSKQNQQSTAEYPSYIGMKEYDDDINLHSVHSFDLGYPSYWEINY